MDARGCRTVAIEQVDREFVPYVSVIQTGTAVTFPNRDAILHHVYSFSPAKSFEIKLYTGKSPSRGACSTSPAWSRSAATSTTG